MASLSVIFSTIASSSGIALPSMRIAPSASHMRMMLASGSGTPVAACGLSICRPSAFEMRLVVTMKMINKTSVMSTSGVTLMPVISSSSSTGAVPTSALLGAALRDDEAERALGQRLGLAERALHTALEDVVGDDRRDRDDEADRRGD